MGIIMGWIKCTLGDAITLQRGFDLPNRERTDGNIPIVSSSGISGWHNKAKVFGPGVVTGRYGTLGEVFFVKDDFWPLNTTLYVRDFKGNDPHYISYFLRTLDLAHHNTAGAVPGVNRNALHLLPVMVPPLATQRRIAAILSAYEDLIENNQRRIAILEEMARNLYREWFVHFRFPGWEQAHFVETELGRVPEGWEVISLDQIMDIQGGAQPPRSEWSDQPRPDYIRMIQIRDYESSNYVCFVKESKNLRRCSQEDIMVARYGASVGRICWGLEGVYNVALVKVIPQHIYYREFLRVYLQQDFFQSSLLAMSGRTAQAGFNKSTFRSIKLVFPKRDELLQRFQQIVEPMMELQIKQKLRIDNLRRQRDMLLPKLVSGEIDVSELEIAGIREDALAAD